ncbi:MAG: DUF262 domain-containing protein [Ruminococcus sp.]|nr:DUF262 domain-containing protein [Ruminococcus sp.]
MAYSIVENAATSFIENRSIQLPRFQRKQTWKEKDNFKLCISVFKGYPIGVVIINSTQAEQIDWLLDGRQRRNALIEMRANPVSVYNWAKAFVKFQNNDDEQQLKDKFFASIDAFLQGDFIKDNSKTTNDNSMLDDQDDFDDFESDQPSFDFGQQYSSLKSLCDLLTIVHPIKRGKSQLERMFLFNSIIPVQDLDYSIVNNGNYIIDIPKLWAFVKVCVNDKYDTKDTFISYLVKRYKLDHTATQRIVLYVEQHWEYFDKCFKTLAKLEQTLQKSTIGIIKLTNASPLDAQNIFSLVNDGGTKLVSEELLSARPFWNVIVNNPSSALKDNVKKLYDKLSIIVPENVCRWDLCASLLLRIDNNNLIFNDMSSAFSNDDDTKFKNVLSLGFKTVSAILVGGINNTSVLKLERSQNINWDIAIDNIVNEINMVISILEDYDYFKYLKAWNQTIMSLTSNTIAIEFISIMHKRWKYYNCPTKSSSAAKQLAKEAFILYDRLVYEYCIRIWAGSSDNKLATDLNNVDTRITQITKQEWANLIDELSTGKFKGKNTKSNLLKPLIYHYYCIKRFSPTVLNISTQYEIDHIVAESLFNNVSSNDDILQMKDNILNFALLPKGENIAKSNQKLSQIKNTDQWLSEQIKKYAEISDADMDTLSDLTNIGTLKNIRLPLFKEAFEALRDTWINN